MNYLEFTSEEKKGEKVNTIINGFGTKIKEVEILKWKSNEEKLAELYAWWLESN